MSSLEPQYEQRVVAYLDVLGTTEAVRQSSSSRRAFFRAAGPFGDIHGFVSHLAVQRDAGVSRVEVSSFSDHVVLTAPASAGIREVLEAAHDLYGRLLSGGRALRGGIVVGEIYHQPGLIFGPALIEAYELESSGGPPRLVVTEELVRAEGGTAALRIGATPTRCPYIVEKDGIHFLHPLRTRCASAKPEDFEHAFAETADSLLSSGQESVREKGAWMQSTLLDETRRRKA